jgi:acyl-coenzyme A synthetase/AMP-(fatty) acid ligase
MTARIACGSDRAILSDVLSSLADGAPCIVPPPTGILGVAEISEQLKQHEIVLYTSGSTGPSRGILRSHESWTASFAPLAELMGLTSNDSVWIPGPLTSTLFLYGAIHTDAVGAELLLSDMSGSTATIAHTVPAIAIEILENIADFPRLRLLVVAGDRLPPQVRDLAHGTGVEILEYYGAAELSFVASRTNPEEELRAFPGVEIAIQDSVIWVRSPYLADRYVFAGGDEAPGPALWRDSWASVGDLGSMENGNLIVQGRGDSAVTVGGHTVVTDDVEHAVRKSLCTAEVAVTGVEHPRFGEILVAVVVGNFDDATLRMAADALPGPARPRRWIRVEALPRTESGKVDRGAVRRLAASS